MRTDANSDALTADALTIRQPDDWHVHLRDGAALAAVVKFTAAQFARAIVMPNLAAPVITTAQALDYRARILAALPAASRFEPLMTLFLSQQTTVDEIDRAKSSGQIHGVKLYPAGATTHSRGGITRLDVLYPVLERMERVGMPLLIHGEATAPDVDVFERETEFIDAILAPLVRRFSNLRIVLEHITTAVAVDFIEAARDGVGATITAHHLLHNRNALFEGGIRPHMYCLPLLKRESDRRALVRAATGGHPRFFLGTDSAPHAKSAKEAGCGCAGIFTAHCALELYAEVFESENKLDKLEGFASVFGSDFYGLAQNSARISLTRSPRTIPNTIDFAGDALIPYRAGGSVAWSLAPLDSVP